MKSAALTVLFLALTPVLAGDRQAVTFQAVGPTVAPVTAAGSVRRPAQPPLDTGSRAKPRSTGSAAWASRASVMRERSIATPPTS